MFCYSGIGTKRMESLSGFRKTRRARCLAVESDKYLSVRRAQSDYVFSRGGNDVFQVLG